MKPPSIDTIRASLPFNLDDTAEVDATFRRWKQHQDAADKSLIDIWTYCFIYRFFLARHTASGDETPPGFDEFFTIVWTHVHQHLDRVCQVGYTSWVAVICRNTFASSRPSKRNSA